MKNAVVGLGSVALLAVVIWCALFGVVAPCDAMKVEAARVADEKNDNVGKAIRDAFVGEKAGQVSGIVCASMSVRMRLFGREGVSVLVLDGRGGQSGKTGQSGNNRKSGGTK